MLDTQAVAERLWFITVLRAMIKLSWQFNKERHNMRKTLFTVFTCLVLMVASVQTSVVQAQTVFSDEKLSTPVAKDSIEIPHYHLPYHRFDEDMPNVWHHPSLEESKERVYTPPSAEIIRLTQKQVQSFDCNTVTDVPYEECEALVALYESTNGAGWFDNSNWLQTTTVGDWNGIVVEDEKAIYIFLPHNNLILVPTS